MKKIIFIEPKNPNIHIFSQFKLPRLGSFVLGTLMKNRGWNAEVILEDYVKIDLDEVAKADIVGISTITATATRAYWIADELRRRGATIMMGGPHVTYFPDEALEHADYIVRGEGEAAMMSFIDQWESSRDFTKVPSLSYRLDGKTVHNQQIEEKTDLDSLPLSDFTLAKGGWKFVIAGQRVIPIQTSRGCPFNCSFCSVTGMFGKQYRYRSTASVIAELKQYNDKKNFIFFCDDNFTDNRKRAKELLSAMIAEGIKCEWSTQVRVDVAKDLELVQLMKKAGCHTLFIGFESVNPTNLARMKKGQTVEHIQKAIDVLQAHKIHVHGMFVYGFEDDNHETIRTTLEFAKKSGMTSAQFLILTPLPGSETFRDFDDNHRILFKDWSLYDTHHVVFKPTRMSAFDLQKEQVYSHRSFYSIPQILKKAIRGNFVGVGIGLYARRVNSAWKKRNGDFVKNLRELPI